MAESRKAGMGRDIIFERGLAEWLCWFSGKTRADTSDISWPFRVLKGLGTAPETASDIVVLFANIIQEAK
jgi:hypothetical protein